MVKPVQVPSLSRLSPDTLAALIPEQSLGVFRATMMFPKELDALLLPNRPPGDVMEELWTMVLFIR